MESASEQDQDDMQDNQSNGMNLSTSAGSPVLQANSTASKATFDDTENRPEATNFSDVHASEISDNVPQVKSDAFPPGKSISSTNPVDEILDRSFNTAELLNIHKEIDEELASAQRAIQEFKAAEKVLNAPVALPLDVTQDKGKGKEKAREPTPADTKCCSHDGPCRDRRSSDRLPFTNSLMNDMLSFLTPREAKSVVESTQQKIAAEQARISDLLSRMGPSGSSSRPGGSTSSSSSTALHDHIRGRMESFMTPASPSSIHDASTTPSIKPNEVHRVVTYKPGTLGDFLEGAIPYSVEYVEEKKLDYRRIPIRVMPAIFGLPKHITSSERDHIRSARRIPFAAHERSANYTNEELSSILGARFTWDHEHPESEFLDGIMRHYDVKEIPLSVLAFLWNDDALLPTDHWALLLGSESTEILSRDEDRVMAYSIIDTAKECHRSHVHGEGVGSSSKAPISGAISPRASSPGGLSDRSVFDEMENALTPRQKVELFFEFIQKRGLEISRTPWDIFTMLIGFMMAGDEGHVLSPIIENMFMEHLEKAPVPQQEYTEKEVEDIIGCPIDSMTIVDDYADLEFAVKDRLLSGKDSHAAGGLYIRSPESGPQPSRQRPAPAKDKHQDEMMAAAALGDLSQYSPAELMEILEGRSKPPERKGESSSTSRAQGPSSSSREYMPPPPASDKSIESIARSAFASYEQRKAKALQLDPDPAGHVGGSSSSLKDSIDAIRNIDLRPPPSLSSLTSLMDAKVESGMDMTRYMEERFGSGMPPSPSHLPEPGALFNSGGRDALSDFEDRFLSKPLADVSKSMSSETGHTNMGMDKSSLLDMMLSNPGQFSPGTVHALLSGMDDPEPDDPMLPNESTSFNNLKRPGLGSPVGHAEKAPKKMRSDDDGSTIRAGVSPTNSMDGLPPSPPADFDSPMGSPFDSPLVSPTGSPTGSPDETIPEAPAPIIDPSEFATALASLPDDRARWRLNASPTYSMVGGPPSPKRMI